jgi:flagellar motor switch protein FliN/FliY
MFKIPEEVVEKLTHLQTQVWQTVGMTVAEACGRQIAFSGPLTLETSTSDLHSEMGAPKLVIQFAFAAMPELSQLIIVPQETFAELGELIRGEPVETADENLIADTRPCLEAIVQGICVAVGNIRDEAVVASGLSIRFQTVTFPPNIQRATSVIRTNVALVGEDINGTLVWVTDSETSHWICKLTMTEEEESQFPTASASLTVAEGGLSEDIGSLDLLLDIPLDLSVELGRVKMLVKDVLELGTGSIVEIEKSAGEPVDVLVNGRVVARGEVVVIEDNFGVRLTEILSPQDRLTRLGEVA